MSYILDAMRRAEADRRHGDLPDAQSPGEPVPTTAPTGGDAPPGMAGVVLSAVVGLAIGFGGYALIARWSSFPPAEQPFKVVPPTPAPGVGAGGTLPAQSWGGNGQLPAAGVARPAPAPLMDAGAQPGDLSKARAAAPPSQAAPAPRPGQTTSVPVTPGVSANAPAPKEPGRSADDPVTRSSSSSPPASTAPAAHAGSAGSLSVQAPAAALPRLHELPPELQREVPSLLVSGWIHSPDPGSRQLLVNGVLLREGDALTPVLRLEMIGRRTAVFSVRGQRFEVPISL